MGKEVVQLVIWGIKVNSSQALLIKNTLAPNCGLGCGFYIKSKSKHFEVALKTVDCEYGESTSYSADCDHVFGVEYAQGDAIKAIKNMPDKVKEEYTTYAIPFLSQLGIKDSPKVILISQTH